MHKSSSEGAQDAAERNIEDLLVHVSKIEDDNIVEIAVTNIGSVQTLIVAVVKASPTDKAPVFMYLSSSVEIKQAERKCLATNVPSSWNVGVLTYKGNIFWCKFEEFLDQNTEVPAGQPVYVTFTAEGVSSLFSAVVLTVDGVDYAAGELPKTFQWISGETHSFSWVSAASDGSQAYKWLQTRGLSTQQSATLQVKSSGYIIATYHLAVIFSVSGLPSSNDAVLAVDDKQYSVTELPVLFTWPAGEVHSFSWVDAVPADVGVRYKWYSTSGISALQSGSFAVPSTGGEVKAQYETQYLLTLNANPTEGGTLSPGTDWFKAGTTVTITASAAQNYIFKNWTGTGQGSYSGASSSAVVMMNGPINETAYFDVYVFHFVDQTSDIDGVADVGAHTAFEQMRNTNNIPDVLTEYGVDDGVLINAFFAYRSNSGTYTVNSLKTRSLDYSTNTLSSENELANSGFSILWVRAAKCPVRDEIIVLTQSGDAYIDMYVWNGQQWTFYSNIAFGSSTTYRCFDVAYEKTSGRALIIYASGSTPSSPIYYRIWDGNSLSAASSIGASWGPYWGGSPYIIYDSVYGQWIEAAQAPGARAGISDDNEIAVAGTVYATLYVIYDPYNGGYYIATYYLWFEAVWNGASWSTRCFEMDYCYNPTGIAVTYEQQSGRVIFVANSYTAKRIYYNYWAGSFGSLSTTDITPLSTYVKYIVAKCAAGSNKILMATMDNNGYVATLLYDGSQWTIHSLHTSAAYNSRRSIDLAWRQNGESAILLYGARTSNTLYYKMFSSNSWSSEASVATSACVAWIQAATDPSENAYALIATLTLDNALVAYKWDSSGFSVSNTITSTCDTYITQPFSFLMLSQAAYNYRLELEVQWLNVNVAYSKYLCIKVMDAQLSESLIVEVYNGQAWVQLATLTSGLNIIDVSAYVTPTFTIRFKDQITSGDRVQNSWRIDYAVLTSVLPRESPLNGWLYRRSFTVASSSSLSNGIVKLTVYYGGGVD
ncbi:MAG: hypothetical protein NWF09_09280, partial [Candidatus Bathyarchaeota archaeon]|nr:hypothetical protein [Candidatus Bathyarchaeota archaeon]